jgi:protein ImuB
MYACLHLPQHSDEADCPAALLQFALSFSPFVEQTPPATVVFSIGPLQRAMGSPHQIAAAISQRQKREKLRAHLSIAPHPDTAILLARHSGKLTIADEYNEASYLSTVPLVELLQHAPNISPDVISVLHDWGLSTCGDLAQLPEAGIVERLGPTGQYLRRLALGQVDRPLRLSILETPYEEHVELEQALACLEPLLFVASRILIDFCERLRSQMCAARKLDITLHLEDQGRHQRTLEFAVPLQDHRDMLKLLQLDIDRHPPGAAVVGFTLRLEPVERRRVQHHLLLPPTPPADKLQITLARIAALVGEGNVGTPELLNTFRPDAFRLVPPADESAGGPERTGDLRDCRLQLALRVFRPALPAKVRGKKNAPEYVMSQGVAGHVLQACGPWKTSGEWWTSTPWANEEWDIALEDGAVYRIYRESQTRQWFLYGVYD